MIGALLAVLLSTPVLYQRSAWAGEFSGSNSPVPGPGSTINLRTQHQTAGGNCLVMIVTFSQANTISTIADDASNSYAQLSGSSVAGTAMKTQVWFKSNASAGGQKIVLTFSAGTADYLAFFMEFSGVDGTTCLATAATSSGAAGPDVCLNAACSTTYSPAAGDLAYWYVFQHPDVTIGNGTILTSMVSGAGWTMEHADLAACSPALANNNTPAGAAYRIAPGGGIVPKITVSGTDPYQGVAFSVVSGAVGTPVPQDQVWLKRITWFTPMGPSTGSCKIAAPNTGNTLIFYDIAGNITAAPTDSTGATWLLVNAGNQAPAPHSTAAFVNNQNASSTRVLTVNFVTNAQDTITIWDVENGSTGTCVKPGGSPPWTTPDAWGASCVFVQQQYVTDQNCSAGAPFHIDDMPALTPAHPFGLVTNLLGVGSGPILPGWASGATAGLLFTAVDYPNENDFDPFNNSDGYGVYYYGSDMSTQHWNWKCDTGDNAIFDNAIEWHSGVSPRPPPQFKLSFVLPELYIPVVQEGDMFLRVASIPLVLNPWEASGEVDLVADWINPTTALVCQAMSDTPMNVTVTSRTYGSAHLLASAGVPPATIPTLRCIGGVQ